jgi:hypothetical protein
MILTKKLVLMSRYISLRPSSQIRFSNVEELRAPWTWVPMERRMYPFHCQASNVLACNISFLDNCLGRGVGWPILMQWSFSLPSLIVVINVIVRRSTCVPISLTRFYGCIKLLGFAENYSRKLNNNRTTETWTIHWNKLTSSDSVEICDLTFVHISKI